MTKAMSWFTTIACIVLISLSSNAHSQMSEKSMLRDSFFGNYEKCKVIKKKGTINLKVWDQHIKYSRTLPEAMQRIMLAGIENLPVEYDEIWKAEYDSLFTPSERKKFKGKFDINTLYWKDNKIQASTLEKFHNPHQIENIYDRAYILNKLSTKAK